MTGNAEADVPVIWAFVGAIGTVLFYGRFYVQWIVSEVRKQSVVPIAFWYLSGVGSFLLLLYAGAILSPNGALGQGFNMPIYARNLVHIWRDSGRLTRLRSVFLHGVAASVVCIAVGIVLYTWLAEYQHNSQVSSQAARMAWLWVGLGAVGQVLYAMRFAVQWATTEMKRKSTIPVSFWWLSVCAAILSIVSFGMQAEWLFLAGTCATLPIYLRNLWLIHLTPNAVVPVE